MQKQNLDELRAVWFANGRVFMIDQLKLPYEYAIFEAKTCAETCMAIKTMITRGAGSIGVAAGFAMVQAAIESKSASELFRGKQTIEATRPTARDLFAATERVYEKALISADLALAEAEKISEETIDAGRKIGEFGNLLIQNNDGILTHCNAGWLALQGYGSALSPIYAAHSAGKNVFVYADETRPRGQGARLTAWELNQAGVPHGIIADNASAHFMQHGKINLVITGADRIAANGDTANKIGTLEKAILANYFGIRFYIAAPSSTFDKKTATGAEIEIEERSGDEVLYQEGPDEKGVLRKIYVASPGSGAKNPAFDVTPYNLITGFITEKGILKPSELGLI